VFPVTIDPTYASGSVTTNLDTYVSSAYPTAQYGTSTELRVGTYNGGGDRYRSFLQFPLASFGGKDIVAASLSLYEFHSWSCTAKPFYSYGTTGQPSSSTTWSTMPGQGSHFGTTTVAKGFSSSCAAGRTSVSVLGAAQYWSGHPSGYGAIQISASETDDYGWKKFYSLESSQDPYITFTYNRKPNAASAPTMDPAYTPSYVDPRDGKTYLFTTDSTPRFYSKATDPDGSPVRVTFEVHNSTAGTAASKVSSCETTAGASGASVYCSPTTVLANNTYYYARAAVRDDRGLWNGTWSAWTKFGTAYNAPPAASVSCPGYANGSWTDTAPAADVVCSIKATGIANDWSTPGYLDLTVDGVVKPRVKVAPTNDPTVVASTVTIPRTATGSHRIVATSVARTGKTGTPTTLSFGFGNATLSSPAVSPRVTTTGRISIAAAGPPKGSGSTPTAKLYWRSASSGQSETPSLWNEAGGVTLAVVDNGSGGVTVSGSWDTTTALLDTSVDSDPGTAGIQGSDLNPRVPVLLDVQVCLAYTAATQCTWSASRPSVMRIPHAFGNGFPTTDAGPGQVALFTGEFNTEAIDVTVPGYTGDLSVSRSHSTYGNATTAPTDAVTGVFGPGWTANLRGSDAGLGGLQVVDSTTTDGTLAFVDTDGTALLYLPDTPAPRRTGATLAASSATVHWEPVDEDTAVSGTTLKVSGSGATTELVLTEDDGTETRFAATTAPATAKPATFAPDSVTEPGSLTTSYSRDSAGRVTRILAPVPPGVTRVPGQSQDCPDAAVTLMAKGCRALRILYQDGAVVSGVTPKLVKQVNAELYNPAAFTTNDCAGTEVTAPAGMASIPVACYTYDTGNHLTSVKDPRTGLTTTYGYGSANQLTSLTPPGQSSLILGYTTLDGRLKLTGVTRPQAAPLTGTATLTRIAYDAPLYGAGLPDLSTAGVAAWAQPKAPSYAAAVFGPDYNGTITQANGATKAAASDWTHAELSYTTADGYTVNTASYGAGQWLRTSTDYDAQGNITRQLDAGAITRVTAEGIPADAADLLATKTYYNQDLTDSTGAVVTPAGTVVTDTYGPARNAWVNADVNQNGVVGDPDDVAPVRPHTHTTYDQNPPTTKIVGGVSLNPDTDQPWRLPTTVTTGAAASTALPADDDLATDSTTVNNYTKLNPADATEGDPWKLGTPAKVTTVMPGDDITTATRFDTEGRTTETRQPLSTGSDAGTTKTIYYTAAPNGSSDPATAACGNHGEWAGLACRTLPAANPTAGAGGAATLPDSSTTAYNVWLQPLTVAETSGTGAGAVKRTTQTRYDTAGRTTASWMDTTGLSVPAPRAGTYTHYIPAGNTAAGSVDYTGNLNAAKTDADPTARTSTTYDAWGRTLTVRNDQGETTTTTYVAAGVPGAGSLATVTDPKGTTTYTYDGADNSGKDAAGKAERRGLLTTQTVTRPGTGGALVFKAAYDADGNLTVQKLPGQLTQATSYDEAGEPVGLTYSGTVQPVTPHMVTDPDTGEQVQDTDPITGDPVYDPDGAPLTDQPWLAWSVVNDAQGRVTSELTGPSAGFDGNPGVVDPTNITGYDTGKAIGYDRSYRYDTAGRLVTVVDHTVTGHGADLAASPCQVRSYGFDANGRRTTLGTGTHTDGDCDGTTNLTTTMASFNYYDTADRPTKGHDNGQGGTGTYTYDALGRQTTMPAVDTPAYAADLAAGGTGIGIGDITVGYFDDDLPASVTQTVAGVATSTTFTLDSSGRRSTATTTTGASTSTLVRHYNDSSDNPAWTDKDGVITRYAQSIGGDLAATINADGSADLTVANLHGDVLTTVPIAASAASGDACTSIDGWSDYTEYGTPRPGSTTGTTGGALGYGWLGAKQRSATAETAGLTLMGDRLYNAVTGRFASLDPQPGGNDTAYSYPSDPVNKFDLDGHASCGSCGGGGGISSCRNWFCKHQAKSLRIAKALGRLSTIVGYCWTLQCGMISAALALLQAAVYWNLGSKRKAAAIALGAGISLIGGRFFNNYIGRHLTRNAKAWRKLQNILKNAGFNSAVAGLTGRLG
jgi:RHS repeat-associated protein